MATGKISKRAIDSLRPASGNQFLWDTDLKGFGAKITPTGAISYIIQFRMGGREASTRRYTIGAHGSPWTPTTARSEAERLLIFVAQGIDPVDADKQRRREAIDLAFDNYAQLFTRSCKGEGWSRLVERVVRLHLQPVLRRKPLPSITRADIVSVLDQMPENQVANRRNVFAVLRRLFRWAVSRGDLDRSPMEGMETPPPVRPRDRWLADNELRLIWNATPECHRCFGPIVRLLITTGQRREEVCGILWQELDRTERLWTLPGQRTKNNEPNRIPLNQLAIAELDALAGGEKWPRKGRVFATATGAGFTGYHKGKAKLDSVIEEREGEPLPPWRATYSGVGDFPWVVDRTASDDNRTASFRNDQHRTIPTSATCMLARPGKIQSKSRRTNWMRDHRPRRHTQFQREARRLRWQCWHNLSLP